MARPPSDSPDAPFLFDLPLTAPPGAPEPPSPAKTAPSSRAPTLFERLKAGLSDLAILLAVGLASLVGAELLGARPDLEDLVPVGIFLLTFSLFYSLIALGFFGSTPGMAWVGLVARAPDGLNLAFGQALRRWFGSLLTLLFAGLPLLLAVGGRRSLSDRLSGSSTHRERLE